MAEKITVDRVEKIVVRFAEPIGLNPLERARRRVLHVLGERPGGATLTTLSKDTGLKGRELTPALEALAAEGLVERCVVRATNGRDYPGYRRR